MLFVKSKLVILLKLQYNSTRFVFALKSIVVIFCSTAIHSIIFRFILLPRSRFARILNGPTSSAGLPQYNSSNKTLYETSKEVNSLCWQFSTSNEVLLDKSIAVKLLLAQFRFSRAIKSWIPVRSVISNW